MLVTRVRIFCTTLFTNNNIKVGIQMDAFLAHFKGVITFCEIFDTYVLAYHNHFKFNIILKT